MNERMSKATQIPDRLRGEKLVRIQRGSKRPVKSPYADESRATINECLANGGPVGVSCLGDLVVVDADAPEFESTAKRILPSTFTVSTPGGGTHRYIRCENWDRCKAWKPDEDEIGSIRSTGWVAVIPPSPHPDGGHYKVKHDVEIEKVDRSVIQELADAIDGLVSDNNAPESPSTDRGTVGAGDLDKLDRLIDHDEYRAKVRDVLEDRNAPHDSRVWLAGFLSDAVGLRKSEIVRLVDRHNRWSNYDQETTRNQVQSVIR